MGNSYLDYERHGARVRIYLNAGDAYRIDRSSQSAARLSDDLTVSLRHAIIQSVEGDNFYVTDLNSRNGTMINGRPISVPTLLKPGDVIRVGTYEFFFHQDATECSTSGEEGDIWRTQRLVSRRLITVLVADIKGYTGLTLRLGESFISDVVGSLFEEAGRVLSANCCWGQKYIGDAVMGVWIHESEVPTSREFEYIFRSLLEVRQAFVDLNKRWTLDKPLAFGTGVNTGYAALGNMGSRHSPDFTALGDSVNKTFRLESATRDLNVDIVLGSLTYDLLSTVTQDRTGLTRHLLHLKGYPRPEEAYVADFATIERILGSFSSSAPLNSDAAAS